MNRNSPGRSGRITIEEVRHVAFLARLSLAPGEEEKMAGEMGRILEYVDSLQALDTDRIEASFQVLPRKNVMRPDLVTPSLSPEQVLANAPERRDDHFLMPRIITS